MTQSSDRKGREERKAEQRKSLHIDKIVRPGTRMTRIRQIFTDYQILAHPCSIPLRDSEAINKELVRTETNSGHSKFVRVSFNSLLIDYHGIGTMQEAAQ
jgi:hypothetical protein